VKPRLRAFARRLRTGSTEDEATLWALLRNRRFAEYKFRRQVPIDRYIADFVCHSAKLVVELDGSQHVESERDVIRDAAIVGHGYRILRVWNNKLTHHRSGVLDAVWHALQPNGGPP
jgi:very-short-patch-repair endonuclease